MPYYQINIKQLLTDKTDNYEVVYNPGKEDEFTEPVEFFALCDLIEKPCQGEVSWKLDDCIGVILPVTFCEDEGLETVLTSEYKRPSEQEVRLRKIITQNKGSDESGDPGASDAAADRRENG